MADLKREDLRVKARDVGGGVVLAERPVTDADLAALGYVPRGSLGAIPWDELEGLLREEGYVRLDVDVEALPSVRDALLSYRELVPNAAAINEAVALIGQVLAALDGEET